MAGDVKGTVHSGYCDTALLPSIPDATKIITLDCTGAFLGNFSCPQIWYNGSGKI